MRQKVKHSIHELFEVKIHYKDGKIYTEHLTMKQYNAINQRKTFDKIKDKKLIGKTPI